MNPIFVFLGLATLSILVGLLISSFVQTPSSKAQKRLKEFEDLDFGTRHHKTTLFAGASSTEGAWPGTALLKKKSDRTTSLVLGGGNPKQQLILLAVVISIVAVFLLLVDRGVLPRPVQNFLPIGILLILVPRMFRIMRIKRIRKKFSELFPAAIRMMTNSLRAGHDIRSSFEMVAEDMPSPAREEFAHILGELNVGVNLDAALGNFQKRMELSDVNIFVVSVLLNNKLGGNLTEMLQKLEYTMRERMRLRKEIKSLTAQAKASAMFLAILVLSMSVYLFVTSADYMHPMWTTTLGLWILILCYVFIMFGVFVMYKMTDLKLE